MAPSELSRRGLLRLSALLGGSAALAACGGPSISESGGAAQSDIDWSGVQPASQITWWSNHPGTSIEMEKEYIRRFQEQNPGITVNLVTAGKNYDEVAQRFQAAAGTDNTPDLVGASDVWWFRYMINGQIIPLDGLAQHLQIDIADYNPIFYEDYAFDGRHWALPYARSTPLFYYNRGVWQQAGLPDRAPETWDEFERWAPALAQVVGGSPLGLGTGTSWAAWWFCNFMWGRGGAYSQEWTLTLDGQETLDAGEYVRALVHDKQFAAPSQGGDDGYVADFSAGVTACTMASTGSLRGILEQAQFEVGTGFLPKGPAGPGCPTGGTGVAIASSKTPEQQLAAGMFLKFLTEPEQTAHFSAGTGYMPVRTSAVDSPDMQAVFAETPQARTAVDQLATTRVQDWVRTFVPSGDQYLTTAIQKIVLQNEGAASAFAAAATEITTSYEQNVARYI
ncbi:ABC transporter substrate-binding protein [Pseudonocardia sp. CNS-004]|nr:ABC transporter substrate-binding protein [Pseudonocardia sp. CNS-004]